MCQTQNVLNLSRKDKTGLILTLLLFLFFGLCYSYYTPLWNPPDEERHYAYCEYIAGNHTLPPLKIDRDKTHIAQAIHPPLYYLIASLFCRNITERLQEEIFVNDGPGFNTIAHPKSESTFPYAGIARRAHLLRLLSLALSMVTLGFIYFLVLTIFPGETLLALATSFFAGMNPQFLHISASVSNENLSTALSTIYLFALLCYLKQPFKTTHLIVTGALLGCCLLSKTSTLFYAPLTVCLVAWNTIRDKRKLIESLLLIFGTAALVAGWWYLRNWLVFDDLLLKKFLIASQPWGLRSTPFSFSYVATLASNTFISFFGNLGALQIAIPRTHLIIYGGITGIGIAGLCWMLVKRELTSLQSRALALLFFSLLGGAGIFLSLNLTYRGVSMGRYLFVVIAPIAILLFAGLRSLITPRWRNTVLALLSLLLIILNLDILFRILKPAYAETLLVEGVSVSQFSHPTVEINHASTITQSFFSSQNNLSAIRVMFSNLNKPKSGEITFSLKEGGDTGKVLRTINLPLEHIKDNARYFFIFPPIKDSMDKEYWFSLSSSSSPPGEGVSLWYESSDCYSGGRMMVNSETVVGDVYFTTYHFTGDYPETDWQGKKVVAIEQDLYVGLREMQLYFERSKEFREQTLTHEKIERIKNALTHRKSLINDRE